MIPITIDEKRAETEHVLQDAAFIRAPKHCKVLEFIFKEELEGRGHQISEKIIASDCFNLDGSTVSLRKLLGDVRFKLAQYYLSGPGRGRAIAMTLPLGSYRPHFERRGQVTAAEGGPRTGGASRNTEVPSCIWTAKQLKTYERNRARGETVWLATPDLLNDVGEDAEFRRVFQRNVLIKDIRYVIIHPKAPDVAERVPALWTLLKRKSRNVKVITVSPSRFWALTLGTHVVIYNPGLENGRPEQVFMEVDENRPSVWVKVRAPRASIVHNRFKQIIDPGYSAAVRKTRG